MAERFVDETLTEDMDYQYLIDIEGGERRIESEKKNYRRVVSKLQEADKKYRLAKRNAEEKHTARAEAKLEAAKEELELAVKAYKDTTALIDEILENIRKCTDRLVMRYSELGKRRSAKKASAHFDRFYAKQQNEISRISANSNMIISVYERENVSGNRATPEQTRETDTFFRPDAPAASVPPSADGASHYNSYAPYGVSPQMYYYPPYFPQPDAYGLRQNVNVAPVNLDVTDIVESAVRETMEKFSSTVEKRIDDYIATLAVPAPVAESGASDESLTSSAKAVDTVATEEKFVVEKLAELIDGLKGIMETVNALSADAMNASDKLKEAVETQREIFESQRSMIRELQGIQVKQKLITGEQEALAEEQRVAVEHQKIVCEKQRAVSEEQKGVAAEIDTVLNDQKAVSETLKETALSHKQLIALAEKNAELQRELTLKQQELISAEKEAISLHKQLMRSQRADAKRRSAALRPQAKTETESSTESDGSNDETSSEKANV